MILLYGYLFYYFSAMVGISIGYHRYFTHKSFITNKIVEIIMLFFGMICGGRSLMTWAAVHRMHHANSDTEHDPHSPKFIGAWSVILSNWRVNSIPKRFIIDLIKNPRVVFFHKYGKYIHITYAATMLLLGLNFFVIFVLMPFLLAWIGFGVLNWATHRSGKPADIILLNLIAPGEGWHKQHHDHPGKRRLNRYDIAGWTIERILIKSKSSN